MTTRSAHAEEKADPRDTLDPHEIDWKMPREGRIGTPAELLGWWNKVFENVRDGESAEGLRAHRVGTAFNWIYALWGEAVSDHRSFKAMLTEELAASELVVSTVYDYMRLADATTEEEAKRYGISKSLLGVDLLPFAQVSTLAQLEKVDLPVENPRTKKPARFPATRRILEQALLAYRLEARGPRAAVARSVQLELRRQQEAIEATLERHPELAELRPTAYIFEGEAKVRVGAFTADQADGLAVLARKLRARR